MRFSVANPNLCVEMEVQRTVVAEEPTLEIAPTAEGDLLSGDDALSWLESLTVGKEDELRAQAEAESQARVDEILGRKSEPVVEEPEPVVAEAPTLEIASAAEGDLLSGDDALSWLESLTVGKEDELRLQAESEAQARVDELLGRAPEPASEPTVVEPEAVIAEQPQLSKNAASAEEGFFGWDAFGEEATEQRLKRQRRKKARWIGKHSQKNSRKPVKSRPQCRQRKATLLSGDDALAWLESLTEGKTDELRLQAESEAQARVNELLGRAPEPTGESIAAEEPETVVAEETVVTESASDEEGFFGWDAFGEEATEAEAPAVQEGALDWEALAEELEETGDVTAVPTAEGDLLSGDDALSWLESLTVGKEDELRLQAESEAQARVDELLGRAPEPASEPTVVEPEAVIAEQAPTVEESASADEGFFGWDAFGEEATEAEAEAPASARRRVELGSPRRRTRGHRRSDRSTDSGRRFALR